MPQTNLVPRSKSKYINKISGVFGGALIGYWPLNERAGSAAIDLSGNSRNGSYTGVDLGQAGIGDRQAAPYFDGVNDYLNLYSAGLAGAFNGAEGTIFTWVRIFDPAVWVDGTSRYLFYLGADGSNYVRIARSTSDNCFTYRFYAGGATSNKTGVAAFSLNWINSAITWSKANDRMRVYLNGIKQGADVNGLGVWAGTLSSNLCLVGAGSKTPTYCVKGNFAHAFALNREATPAEMLAAGKL